MRRLIQAVQRVFRFIVNLPRLAYDTARRGVRWVIREFLQRAPRVIATMWLLGMAAFLATGVTRGHEVWLTEQREEEARKAAERAELEETLDGGDGGKRDGGKSDGGKTDGGKKKRRMTQEEAQRELSKKEEGRGEFDDINEMFNIQEGYDQELLDILDGGIAMGDGSMEPELAELMGDGGGEEWVDEDYDAGSGPVPTMVELPDGMAAFVASHGGQGAPGGASGSRQANGPNLGAGGHAGGGMSANGGDVLPKGLGPVEVKGDLRWFGTAALRALDERWPAAPPPIPPSAVPEARPMGVGAMAALADAWPWTASGEEANRRKAKRQRALELAAALLDGGVEGGAPLRGPDGGRPDGGRSPAVPTRPGAPPPPPPRRPGGPP